MYVRPEYFTCTPALCILDVRTVLSILHVPPSEYLTCTPVMSVLQVRTVLSIFTSTSVMSVLQVRTDIDNYFLQNGSDLILNNTNIE
jgi:hypothetical protein